MDGVTDTATDDIQRDVVLLESVQELVSMRPKYEVTSVQDSLCHGFSNAIFLKEFGLESIKLSN